MGEALFAMSCSDIDNMLWRLDSSLVCFVQGFWLPIPLLLPCLYGLGQCNDLGLHGCEGADVSFYQPDIP